MLFFGQDVLSPLPNDYGGPPPVTVTMPTPDDEPPPPPSVCLNGAGWLNFYTFQMSQ